MISFSSSVCISSVIQIGMKDEDVLFLHIIRYHEEKHLCVAEKTLESTENCFVVK